MRTIQAGADLSKCHDGSFFSSRLDFVAHISDKTRGDYVRCKYDSGYKLTNSEALPERKICREEYESCEVIDYNCKNFFNNFVEILWNYTA